MRGLWPVQFGEIPSTKKWNAHSLEIVSIDDGVIAQAQLRTRGRLITFHRECMCPPAKKGQIRGTSRSGTTRHAAQFLHQLFVKRSHLLVLRVLRGRQIDRGRQNMFGPKAWIGSQDSLEAVHQ